MGRLIGYARVSDEDAHGAAQKAALQAVPVDLLFFEQESGANRNRPELAKALRALRAGDVLIVHRLERLGRSLIHLLEIMEDLKGRGIAFRSLAEGFDLGTPEGRLMMQQLGAYAEFERHRIIGRVNSGIAAAKRRGVAFGNPGLVAGDKAAKAKISKARREGYAARLVERMGSFMPTVRELRPQTPWPEVAAQVSAATGENWTVKRLLRSVHGLAAQGSAFVDAKLLTPAPRKRRRRSDELAAIVAGMRTMKPDASLRTIASQLETMGIKTPRGGQIWSAQSVANLLASRPPSTQQR